MYTAELRLSAKTTTLDERRRRVDDVLGRLRLRPCAHVRIGSALDKGVSGGQAKCVFCCLMSLLGFHGGGATFV